MKPQDFLLPATIFCFLLSVALLDMYRHGGYPQLECTLDKDCKLLYDDCECEAVFADVDRGAEDSEEKCEVNRCMQSNVRAVCVKKVCVRSDGKSPPLAPEAETSRN